MRQIYKVFSNIMLRRKLSLINHLITFGRIFADVGKLVRFAVGAILIVFLFTPTLIFEYINDGLFGLFLFFIGPFVGMFLYAIVMILFPQDDDGLFEPGILLNMYWKSLNSERKSRKVYAEYLSDLKTEKRFLTALLSPKPTILFLRPFQDDNLKIDRTTFLVEEPGASGPGSHWARAGGMSRYPTTYERTTTENIFLKFGARFKNFGHTIIIGGRGFYANEVQTNEPLLEVEASDAKWFKVFESCALKSRAIFFLPGNSPGILDELRFIGQNDLLGKLIICMPSATDQTLTDRESRWNEIKAFFNDEYGYCLPAYDKNGLLYIPNKDLSVKYGIVAKELSNKRIESLFAQISDGEHHSFGDIMSDVNEHLSLGPLLRETLTDYLENVAR